jgi:hypothetical protein
MNDGAGTAPLRVQWNTSGRKTISPPKPMKKLLSLAMIAAVAVLAGCEKSNEQKIEDAAKDAQKAAGDAAAAAGDAAKDASKAASDALKK